MYLIVYVNGKSPGQWTHGQVNNVICYYSRTDPHITNIQKRFTLLECDNQSIKEGTSNIQYKNSNIYIYIQLLTVQYIYLWYARDDRPICLEITNNKL